jgi:lysophospholipase L1-like esterase
VLSIPDWGVTPFAEGRDRKQVAQEIDAFNSVCENLAASFQTHFINITPSQRADGNKTEFLAPDGLHPSGMEYKKWADKLTDRILKAL